jgi:hypothetical protein
MVLTGLLLSTLRLLLPIPFGFADPELASGLTWPAAALLNDLTSLICPDTLPFNLPRFEILKSACC